MSTSIVIPSATHHLSLNNERSWESARSFELTEPRFRSEKLELPSFRDTFGDILHASSLPTPEARTHSPPAAGRGPAVVPDYVPVAHSNKRRREDTDDGQDWRPSQVPRLHHNPESRPQRQLSPPTPRGTAVASSEPWLSPSQVSRQPPSNYHTAPAGISAERQAASVVRVGEPGTEAVPKPQHVGPYVTEGPPVGQQHQYQATGYGPPAHQQERYETSPSSATSGRFYERIPFVAGGYGPQYSPNLARYVDNGYIGINGGSKPRKRRGNLPKETTDKLRAWFMAHLSHPYPTEDEKQELMHQTKLQMNQISNWFINARRRQLPVMASSSQAEQDAIMRHNGEKRLHSKAGSADYGHERQGMLSLSDDEGRGSAADEDLQAWRERASVVATRESV